MFTAVFDGDLEALKILLRSEEKNPVIFDENIDPTKSTVLHKAAKFGHLNIVKFFNDELGFTDINPSDEINGDTPLSLAKQHSNWDIVKYYIENGYTHIASSKNFSLYLFIILTL